MTSRRERRARRGFTLIELMIVVAIIGVLSSIAIPSFQLLTLKAKAAERPELVLRLKKAVEDLYLQNGRAEITADFQPALPPSPSRRIPDWRSGDWPELLKTGEEILGAVYYSYRVDAWEQSGSNPAGFLIEVVGDLDGDGVYCDVVLHFERKDGVYQQVAQDGDMNAYPY